MKRKNKKGFEVLSIGKGFSNVDIAFSMISGDRPYQPQNYEIRSRFNYPYSYSPIIIWGEEDDTSSAQYSDRLYQQNYDLTEKLCVKHFGNVGQYFNNRDPAKIEAFLRERLERPDLKLTMIVEWCNVSNGYPLWSFHFAR